ncbi:MAG: permease [Planctomycetes bacterium]|nr:permease [Planctomycetota bacterium]
MTTSQILSYCILGTIIALLAFVAWRSRGGAGIREAGRSSGTLFLSVLPNLILGFTIAGFLQVLLPKETIARVMGDGSGWRGLFAGSVAGMLTPGGPFTHFPILAGFLKAGAGVGPVSAYVAGWALLGVNRIVIWEIPILGWRFVLARVVACLFVPPLCGWLAGLIFPRLQVG